MPDVFGPEAPELTDLLTKQQLLEEVPALTQRHLDGLVAARRVPYYKLGGKIFFSRSEIRRHIGASRVEVAQ